MVDKITFMETLHSVQEIIQTNAQLITREMIQEYFKEMDLSKEQYEMIYQYLLKSQEEPTADVLTLNNEKENETFAASKTSHSTYSDISQNMEHSEHFQSYLNEIRKIPALSEEKKFALYKQLLSGDRGAIEGISRQWLGKIIEMAKTYVSDKLLLEDLIQEGNVGLLLGIEQIVNDKNQFNTMFSISNLESKLEAYVKKSIESYQREVEGLDNSEYTILAKVNLIHAAQKTLAEQSGMIPTLQELSKYTRLPVEEIENILALPKEANQYNN